MKWPYLIVLTIVLAGLLLAIRGVGKEVVRLETETGNLEHVFSHQYLKSPDEIKWQIEKHRASYNKIRIKIIGLIDGLKPYIKDSDLSELTTITMSLVDQCANEIHNAEQALKSNNIKSANASLAKAAQELENLYSVQESLLELKRKLTPAPSAPKNNGLIKSAQSPGNITRGFLYRYCIFFQFIIIYPPLWHQRR